MQSHSLHVIFGTGPVGMSVMETLHARGYSNIVMVNPRLEAGSKEFGGAARVTRAYRGPGRGGGSILF